MIYTAQSIKNESSAADSPQLSIKQNIGESLGQQ